jgi:hypothetical protein
MSFPGFYNTFSANQQSVTLQASGTVTATGTGTTTNGLGGFTVACFELDVTAAAQAAADKLDVYIQGMVDGTNFVDIVHFTQIAGNGSAKRYFSKLVSSAALTEFENGTALGAAAARAIITDAYRVRWVVVNDTAPSFAFSVSANFQA